MAGLFLWRSVWKALLSGVFFFFIFTFHGSVLAIETDPDFIITVKSDNVGITSNTQFTVPTTGSGYNYNVDCDNDGTNDATGIIGNYTCNYPSAGIYTIRISDNSGLGIGFPRIYFNGGGDKDKLLTVENWGTGHWTSMSRAFYGCSNMTFTASDAPDLSNVTDISLMFYNASNFNQYIGGWDTSNVTNMSYMFYNAPVFNQNIGSWVTASVTDMRYMFYNDSAFNQGISGWNVANVTRMGGMFCKAISFNKDISGWNTSNVTDMSSMFFGATSFNQNIGGWNTSKVTAMGGMFGFASTFNQNIGLWDTSNVTGMSNMFNGASVFNQDISNWNVLKVTNAQSMFWNVKLSTVNYDSLLTGWDAQILKTGVFFDGGNSTYCLAGSSRADMISTYSWTITDGGKDCTGILFNIFLPLAFR